MLKLRLRKILKIYEKKKYIKRYIHKINTGHDKTRTKDV